MNPQPHTPAASPNRSLLMSSRYSAARRRGSVLVLATVVVVLLAMLGAGFVQMSRLDRVATSQMDNRTQDFEGSILRYIGGLLADDVLDGDQWLTADMEKYDYPWTNSTTQSLIIDKWLKSYDVTDLGNFSAAYPGTNGDGEFVVQGGLFDDTWLGAIELDFTGSFADTSAASGPYWPHITNLNGIFLDLETFTTVGTSTLPTPYAATADRNDDSGDTEILLSVMEAVGNEGKFADADGDGILDSRWTWAPLPDQFGLTYVMAVRIVDNSAMADLNTWTVTSDSSGQYTSGNDEAPRWYWPGDLDLRASVQEDIFPLATGDSIAVLEDIVAAQRGIEFETGNPNNPNFFRDRYRNWLAGSRPYNAPGTVGLGDYAEIGTRLEKSQGTGSVDMNGGTTFARFDRDDEAELRWRNGLNRSSDNTSEDPPVDIEAAGDVLYWRNDGVIESDYMDIAPTPSVQAFFENNPRLRLTAFSGSSDRDKVDLNHASGQDISDRLSDNMDLYPKINVAGLWTTAQLFGDRVGATVVDFRDGDSVLERVGDTYGMEYLPFISEIYVQGRYDVEVESPNASLPPGETATWTLQDIEYAIEIVNPWPVPIDLTDVEVDLIVNGVNFGQIDQLLAADGVRTTPFLLEGGETVTFLVEDAGDTTGTGSGTEYGDSGAGEIVDISSVAAAVWPNNTVNADNAVVITVALRAEASDGGDATYQEFASAALSETITKIYPNLGDALAIDGITGTGDRNIADAGYMQFHTLGTANGLSAIAVAQDDLTLIRRNASPDPPAGTTEFQALNDYPRFGNADVNADLQFTTLAKGANDSDGNSLDTRVQDNTLFPQSGAQEQAWLIGNTGVIYRSADLGRMILLGPTTTQTVAEVWDAAATNHQAALGATIGTPTKQFWLSDFMIDPLEDFIGATGEFGSDRFRVQLAAPNPRDNLYEQRITFGIELLDRVTTLSPNDDDLDNDGDSRIDDEDEQLIPGRININTASRDLLARALPFDGASDYASASGRKRALIDLIVNTRVQPSFGGPPSTKWISNRQFAHQGIAWMGELLEDPMGNNTKTLLSDLTSGNAIYNAITDFNEYEQGDPSTPTVVGLGVGLNNADGLSDDREEQLIALAALNQVASVRSDVFTAYILVRGYPSSDFSNGGTNDPVEEYRITATFDRSVVHESRPLPLLRAVSVYRQP